MLTQEQKDKIIELAKSSVTNVQNDDFIISDIENHIAEQLAENSMFMLPVIISNPALLRTIVEIYIKTAFQIQNQLGE